MSKVRTSPYRQTPTPEGLKAIEEGTLDYFDTEMYANFNTEVLEEYLEEKNRRDGFGSTTWKCSSHEICDCRCYLCMLGSITDIELTGC